MKEELELFVEFNGEAPKLAGNCLAETRLSKLTRLEFSPKKAAGDFDFGGGTLLLSGIAEPSPLKSKASETPLLAGLSLIDKAENSSTSPLFVGEIGAKGSLVCGFAGTGSQGSLVPTTGGVELLAGGMMPSTAQGSFPHIPPIGGSGDLAGGGPQGSLVVGGDVTREGGPDAGEPHGSGLGREVCCGEAVVAGVGMPQGSRVVDIGGVDDERARAPFTPP